MRIIIDRALDIWGPGRKCVLCRALWSLLPSGGAAYEVPEEVAEQAIAAGAARLSEPEPAPAKKRATKAG